MIKNAMPLKDRARNIAISKNITIQEVLQSYMFERILKRISLSKYKANIANNIAFISTGIGVIKEYMIYINFEMKDV